MNLVFFGAHGASQAAHSGNTCFLLRQGQTRLLVDAGGDPVLHLRRAGVSLLDFDAVVLTHRHTDHVYALPSIIHNLRMARRVKPLTVIGNADVLAFADRVLDSFGLLSAAGATPLDRVEIAAGDRLAVGDLDLTFFDARHSVPCHGFVAAGGGGRAVYAADSGPNPAIIEMAGAAPVLIHEATDGMAHEAILNGDGHSSARQAGQAAGQLGAHTLFLCGMRSLTPDDDEILRREAEGLFAGKVIVPVVDAVYDLDGPP